MQLELVSFFEINSPLSEYAQNVTSQHGEDGITARIIELIQPEHDYCVEFGAWDGVDCSNCCNLIINNAWHGVMIEGNPVRYQELLKTYASNEKVKCVNKFVSWDGANSLDNILGEFDIPENFSVLSVDIDGNDYYIWESLKKYSPELVIIEFNPTVPNDVIFVQDKSLNLHQGCSLLSLIILGRKKGYELVCCTGWNAFFVRSEKYEACGVPDNFISKLYSPLQDGRIFYGYDSSVLTVGIDRLMWKNGIALSSADFQVLPESMRVFVDAQAQ